MWFNVSVDFAGEMRKPGFEVNEKGPSSRRYAGDNLLGTKSS